MPFTPQEDAEGSYVVKNTSPSMVRALASTFSPAPCNEIRQPDLPDNDDNSVAGSAPSIKLAVAS